MWKFDSRNHAQLGAETPPTHTALLTLSITGSRVLSRPDTVKAQLQAETPEIHIRTDIRDSFDGIVYAFGKVVRGERGDIDHMCSGSIRIYTHQRTAI